MGPPLLRQKKFNNYIDFARSIMRTLPAEEVPSDLTESHIYVKACDLYDGFYDQLGEEDLRDAKAVLGLAKVMGGPLVQRIVTWRQTDNGFCSLRL